MNDEWNEETRLVVSFSKMMLIDYDSLRLMLLTHVERLGQYV